MERSEEAVPLVAAAAPAPAPVEGTAVFISNISPNAAEKTVSDFCSFCGEIKSLVLRRTAGLSDGTQEAIVTFESPAAAKTALLLTNALIVDRAIAVRAHIPEQDTLATDRSIEKESIEQKKFGVPDSQRSKTSVVATMIAAGYVLGEDAKKAAMDYDEKHRITATMKEKATQIDERLGITAKVNQATTFVSETLTATGITQAAHTVGAKISETAATAKIEADKLAARAAETAFVQGALAKLKSAGATISGAYESLVTETHAAIEAKHQERGIEPVAVAPPTVETAPSSEQQPAVKEPTLYPTIDDLPAVPTAAAAPTQTAAPAAVPEAASEQK